MPSRHPLSPPPPRPIHHHRNHHSTLLLILGVSAAFLVLLLLAVLYRKLTRRRTAPADLKPPHRFSYSALRRATSSFSSSNRLGQGGFGSVYRGTLRSGQEIAVKVMDSGSLQGEREFQNELSLAGKIESDHVVSLIGFSSDNRRRRMLLVYELMHNKSLQDALLYQKCQELMEWKRRFAVALDVARGLRFLHSDCNPPIIHGDVKPSNILLDKEFKAKIADFGLARVKVKAEEEGVVVEVEGSEGKNLGGVIKGKKLGGEASEGVEDNGSIVEEIESVATAVEEVSYVVDVDVDVDVEVSPESVVRVREAEGSPDTITFEASPSEILDKTSVSDGNFDKLSVDSRKDLVGGGNRGGGRKKSLSGRDWWWKQENGRGTESGGVKEYVMEWIGTEIKKERPKSDWISSTDDGSKPAVKAEKKKQQRRLEWWTALDENEVCKEKKSRPAREWWREEFCDELTKKKKKRELKTSNRNAGDAWWQRDDDSIPTQMKKKRSKNRGSRSSIDGWLDGLSGEFRIGRRNSRDWTNGEIPKSGVSSTPSMRGTVCYVAPEYGGGGHLSEKCDVYSYGVLVLVLVSGRRPLQVTASPMSEFERANLISWARHLAHRGKLQDLFDPALKSLDQEQALLCATVALLCLQRSPAKRPTMGEIVDILSGEAEPPHLPVDFSPSPPSKFPFKSRRKAR